MELGGEGPAEIKRVVFRAGFTHVKRKSLVDEKTFIVKQTVYFLRSHFAALRISTPPRENRACRGPRAFGREEGFLFFAYFTGVAYFGRLAESSTLRNRFVAQPTY